MEKYDDWTFLADGPWDLQKALAYEARQKGLALAPHYYRYYDLRKEFLRCWPEAAACFHPRPHLRGMLTYLGLQLAGRHHSGLADCHSILQVVSALLDRGHSFSSPHTFDDTYRWQEDPVIGNFHLWMTESSDALDLVTRVLELPADAILNVYQVAYNGPSLQYQYTFKVVVQNFTALIFDFYRGNIHVEVYSRERFDKELRRPNILLHAALSSGILKEQYPPRVGFFVRRLKAVLLAEVGTALSYSRRKWAVPALRRFYPHALRLYSLALQLLEGRVTDPTPLNDAFNVEAYATFPDYEKRWRPLLEQLDTQVKSRISAIRAEVTAAEATLSGPLRVPGLALRLGAKLFFAAGILATTEGDQTVYIADRLSACQAASEAHGLVLAGDRVLCYPAGLTKEPAELDWATVTLTPYLEGTLCSLYHWAGQWHTASLLHPHGLDFVGAETVKSVFYRLLAVAGGQLPPPELAHLSFSFQLVRSSGHYDRLVLLAVRNMLTLEEIPPATFAHLYSGPQLQSCSSLAEATYLAALRGYVACDARFHRAKLISPNYLAWKYLGKSLGDPVESRLVHEPRAMLQLVRALPADQHMALAAAWPRLQALHQSIAGTLQQQLATLQPLYASLASLPLAEFANVAQKSPHKKILFALRKGGLAPTAYLATCTITEAEAFLAQRT